MIEHPVLPMEVIRRHADLIEKVLRELLSPAPLVMAGLYFFSQSQHHSKLHLWQVMWLHPPFFSMCALQRGHAFVLLDTHSDVCSSSMSLSPY